MSQSDSMKEEDYEDFTRLGLTLVARRRELISPEFYQELKYIFDISFDTTLEYYIPSTINPYLNRSCHPGKTNFIEDILDLPHRLPKDHDVSGNLLLVFETPMNNNVMVLVIDWSEITGNVSLFHVFTRRFKERVLFFQSGGYAVIDGRLHFVGGCFPDHNLLYSLDETVKQLKIDQHVDNVEDDMSVLYALAEEELQRTKNKTKHLDVPTYNLRTGEWELDTSHLNGPKPKPVVFVYDGNIFALRGRPSYPILEGFPLFEVLDTKIPSTSWTPLIDPPFDMEYYSHHILDEGKGVLFLYLDMDDSSDDSEDSDEDSDEYSDSGEHSSEDDIGPTYTCRVLDLEEKPLQWCSLKSYITKFSGVGLAVNYLSREQTRGCIVDNILFCYDANHKSGKPVILGHDLSNDRMGFEPWVVDGLYEALEGKVEICGSFGFLNHIGNLRFCLIIEYLTGFRDKTKAIFFLTFDLVKEYLDQDPVSSEVPKVTKFEFSLTPVCNNAFQLPTGFQLQCCKKL